MIGPFACVRWTNSDITDYVIQYTDFHIYVTPYIMNAMMKPESLFNILSDPTRLRALMLIQSEGEVCVCELIFALNESQPKISRHLALMRDAGIVRSRREGTWMHYRIEPKLPNWGREIIAETNDRLHQLNPYKKDRQQLARMNNRPERECA